MRPSSPHCKPAGPTYSPRRNAKDCDLPARHHRSGLLIKNHPPAIAESVNALPDDAQLCTSFITWADLLERAERSPRKPEVVRRREASARQVTVLYSAGPAICQHHGFELLGLQRHRRPGVVQGRGSRSLTGVALGLE